MTFGSLFSGCGGMDIGLEKAGLTCAWQVEINPFCQDVLAKRWPAVRRWQDVRTFRPDESWACNVIAGGFPCQDISNAGKREGIDGERSGLWGEFARIIRQLRPQYVIVENVGALLVRGMERVLGDLADIGLDAEWDVLPASAFGAYHERPRVFILAYRPRLDGHPRRLLEESEDGAAQLQFGRFHHMVTATERRARNIRFEREPRLARMVDGVPDRTHRLEAIGNAVDPRVAEYIGRRIMAVASLTRPSGQRA